MITYTFYSFPRLNAFQIHFSNMVGCGVFTDPVRVLCGNRKDILCTNLSHQLSNKLFVCPSICLASKHVLRANIFYDFSSRDLRTHPSATVGSLILTDGNRCPHLHRHICLLNRASIDCLRGNVFARHPFVMKCRHHNAIIGHYL